MGLERLVFMAIAGLFFLLVKALVAVGLLGLCLIPIWLIAVVIHGYVDGGKYMPRKSTAVAAADSAQARQ